MRGQSNEYWKRHTRRTTRNERRNEKDKCKTGRTKGGDCNKMSDMELASVAVGDMTNTVKDFSVDPIQTDGPTDGKETEYKNTNWSQQLGYYKTIPELRTNIDALARWTIGKGLTAPETTEMLLMSIKGFGKDTFNTILENQVRVSKIAGDSFAEIIRDDEEVLTNLKPLDPGIIKIIANQQGLIIRYEQVSKTKKPDKKFKPDEIFHLSRNRTADEIHGISIVEAVKEIIDMRNEAMKDMRTLMHRYVKPIIKWELDTDNPTQIAAFKANADLAVEDGEDIFIPMVVVTADILAVTTNSTLNSLPWIDRLNNYFSQAIGVPQILVGGSQEMTEATAKIAYLAFEQTIAEEQLYIVEQVLSQLNLEIELEMPASLQNEMLSDQSKSETMQAATPEDTSAEMQPVQQQGVQ